MEYSAEAIQEDGMRFEVKTGTHSITTDYPLDPGATGAGPRPLELLLGSLAACAGGALTALLKRSAQPVTALRIKAIGQRRAEHPTVFTDIMLEFVVTGPVEESVVGKVIEQAEAHICPVWAMLKPGTSIKSSFRIER